MKGARAVTARALCLWDCLTGLFRRLHGEQVEHLAVRRWTRSLSRAREAWLRTVPAEMPRIAAISASGRSS
jgi:hypothetical protein